MGYKRTQATVYIVYWPDIRVVKAGYSYNQRWRAFERRGAVIVDLVPCEDWRDAFALEHLVDRALQRACRKRPFRSAEEATPYLGNRGGGYLECWHLPAGVSPMDILTTTDWEEVA